MSRPDHVPRKPMGLVPKSVLCPTELLQDQVPLYNYLDLVRLTNEGIGCQVNVLHGCSGQVERQWKVGKHDTQGRESDWVGTGTAFRRTCAAV